MNHATELIKRYQIISEQIEPRELAVILRECEHALMSPKKTSVSVVELGCYEGTTSLFLQRLLKEMPSAKLHVYDSFTGLPPKTDHDISPAGEQFVEGELVASKKLFIRNFKQAGLPLPVIHKAWFNQLTADDMPNNITFALLDGDYYQSITDSLRLIWPRLCYPARIVIDDYQNEALPGVKKAVDKWLKTHPARLRVEASLALLALG